MSLAFTRRNKRQNGGSPQTGGDCSACSLPPPPQMGGGCPCKSWFKGGYRATAKNRKYLKLYKQGKSIGFTMLASLKAKGLIPRTSRKNKGKKVLGPKYK
uniref:Uncharacterized protein n=1 Tax=viral metagenome TaxID=1070528 RepID=A0A6C0KA23_9ZZZZ